MCLDYSVLKEKLYHYSEVILPFEYREFHQFIFCIILYLSNFLAVHCHHLDASCCTKCPDMNDMQIHLAQMPVSVYLPAGPFAHLVVQSTRSGWCCTPPTETLHHCSTAPPPHHTKPLFCAALARLLSN